MKTFEHPRELQVGDKVRIIAERYSITKIGSEGIVRVVEELEREYNGGPHCTIEFYKLTGRKALTKTFDIRCKDVEII
jgi:sorbitol-specific phosphotransferase system component IIA